MHHLEMVTSFKYLGRVILAADDELSEVVQNIVKAQMVWRRMSRILRREVERPRVSVFFFKSIVQSVLLFGAETWVVTPHMGWDLGGFQDQVTRRIMGRLPQRSLDGRRECTSTEAARAKTGFEIMETYIQQRQNMVPQYIGTQSILKLCDAAEREKEAKVGMRWW